MSDPISSPSCPDCGAPLPADSPQALCPACLMRQALASRTVVRGERKNAAPPPPPEEIADRFPQFEILECLGRGGMGVVYKARQKSLNRLVAIKILAPEREHEAGFAGRFAREAELLARLNHPHIVTIHDFGETGGLFYLVMEYVDGVNLRDLLRDGKLEPKQALAIVPPICEALQYAHDKGIVHRDIKPENLLLDREGRIKIADFGIASLIGTGGENIGTPPYMAPEQRGDAPEVDCRADIYALGVVLYEMLTGERPSKDLVAPSKKVHIDVRLDEMVLRALEKEPERRYQTAGEFRTVVETMRDAPFPEAAPSSGLLKLERGRLAVLESPITPIPFPAAGELALHSDRLIISSGNTRREVALNAIRGLCEAVTPWWFNPAGHRFAAVDFDENGERRRLVFMPGEAVFRLVETTRLQASEWLTAIQRAIKAATGEELSVSQSLSVIPLKSASSLLWLLPSVLVAAVLGKWLIGSGFGSGLHPVDLLVFLPILVPLVIPLVILAKRNRAVGRGRTDANLPAPLRSRGSGFKSATIIRVIWAGMAVILAALAVLWWSKREPDGVWIPTRISDSIDEQFGQVQLRVTGVAQEGQVVLVDFVCETHDLNHELVIQYSGPLLDYPSDLASSVMAGDKHPDCLISPTSSLAGAYVGEVLAGARDVTGKRAFRFGFVLPDAKTATDVAGQLREVHLGKPRGLTGNRALALFMLHRKAGENANGTPVVEGLSAMLFWQAKPETNSTQKPITPEILAELAKMRDEAARDIEVRSRQPAEEDPAFLRRIQERADRAEQLLHGTVAEPVFKEQHRLIREIDAARKSGDTALQKQLEAKTDSLNEQLEKLIPLPRNETSARLKTGKQEIPGDPQVSAPKPETDPANETQSARTAVEDLALQMIVAIREKDDAQLKSLACDQIKGWRDALPVFAVEMREHYRQGVGDEKFDLRAVESLVDGDLAAVKCTGPEKLKDVCLIQFFAKTDEGWRNHSLRVAIRNAPLAKLLADFKTKLRK